MTMIDIDDVASFMTSIVTNFCASCGDSLETMLEDTNAPLPNKEAPDANPCQMDQVVACSIDGMSLCHSVDFYGEKQTLETQNTKGTDLIFFPPYSTSHLTKKKHFNNKTRLRELEYASLILGNGREEGSTKSNVSKPSEGSKWILMIENQHQYQFDEIHILNPNSKAVDSKNTDNKKGMREIIVTGEASNNFLIKAEAFGKTKQPSIQQNEPVTGDNIVTVGDFACIETEPATQISEPEEDAVALEERSGSEIRTNLLFS